MGAATIFSKMRLIFSGLSSRRTERSDAGINDNFMGFRLERAGAGSATVRWNNINPVDHVLLTWSPDGENEVLISSADEGYTIKGLRNGEAYSVNLTAVDENGDRLSPISISAFIQDTEKTVVYISDIWGLKNISCDLNGYYFLESSINLSGTEWCPIGEYGEGSETTRAFTGVFDGGNNEVSNLRVENFLSDQGFFGSIENGAAVMNVIFRNASIYAYGYAGVVTGNLMGASVINCHLLGGKVEGEVCLGGITGSVEGGYPYPSVISGCSNSAVISGTDKISGGIAGLCMYPDTVISECENKADVCSGEIAGGIIGTIECSGVIVEKCINTGCIKTSGDYAGGILGIIMIHTVPAAFNILIGYSETVRNAKVNEMVSCINSGTVKGLKHIGGIAGYLNGYCSISFSGSWGNIEGEESVGMLVGSGYGGETFSVYQCYGTESVAEASECNPDVNLIRDGDMVVSVS